jgi:hypothetical protein
MSHKLFLCFELDNRLLKRFSFEYGDSAEPFVEKWKYFECLKVVQVEPNEDVFFL